MCVCVCVCMGAHLNTVFLSQGSTEMFKKVCRTGNSYMHRYICKTAVSFLIPTKGSSDYISRCKGSTKFERLRNTHNRPHIS